MCLLNDDDFKLQPPTAFCTNQTNLLWSKFLFSRTGLSYKTILIIHKHFIALLYLPFERSCISALILPEPPSWSFLPKMSEHRGRPGILCCCSSMHGRAPTVETSHRSSVAEDECSAAAVQTVTLRQLIPQQLKRKVDISSMV